MYAIFHEPQNVIWLLGKNWFYNENLLLNNSRIADDLAKLE